MVRGSAVQCVLHRFERDGLQTSFFAQRGEPRSGRIAVAYWHNIGGPFWEARRVGKSGEVASMMEPKPGLSFVEFVEWEQSQEERGILHEFIAGRIVVLAAGSFDHELITVNVIAALLAAVKLPCRVFPSTAIVQTISRRGMDGYRPDVTVSCAEGNVGAGLFVQEPRVVVEVLSSSNAGRHWNAKIFQYYNTQSIEQLVFIDSLTRYTESHLRDASGIWVPQEIICEDDGTLEFPHIDASMSLDAIYRTTSLAP